MTACVLSVYRKVMPAKKQQQPEETLVEIQRRAAAGKSLSSGVNRGFSGGLREIHFAAGS